jgi:N-methylhydantoinase A
VDKVWTQAFRSTDVDPPTVQSAFDRIAERALGELRQEGYEGEAELRRAISMRYLGQNYEHEVELADGPVTDASLTRAFRRFDELHSARYGYRIEGETIELVSFKVTAIGRRPAVELVEPPAVQPHARRTREVFFRGSGFVEASVVHRATLATGDVVAGPALIEEEGSTTLVGPGMLVERHAQGSLIITTETAQ